MKSLLSVATLLATMTIAASAKAEDWWTLTVADDVVYFGDAATVANIMVAGKYYKRLWVSMDYVYPEKGVARTQVMYLMKCSELKQGIKAVTKYDAKGSVLWSTSVNDGQFETEEVGPGTVGSLLLNFACTPAAKLSDENELTVDGVTFRRTYDRVTMAEGVIARLRELNGRRKESEARDAAR